MIGNRLYQVNGHDDNTFFSLQHDLHMNACKWKLGIQLNVHIL